MIFATDLALPEGPVLLEDGTWLVTELDLSRGRVTRISAEGTTKWPVATTGRPNGLAVDRNGVVWVAESLEPALIRLELSGSFERVLTEVDGRPLLWPNDLAFGLDGAIYCTDSGVLVGDFLDEGKPVEHWASLPLEGFVFRYDPVSGDAWLIDEGPYRFTNGIAFGPDGMLYVNETMTGNVYRYRIAGGRAVGERELFGNVLAPDYTSSALRGPDGMKFSMDGRLWVTVFGQGDVTVLGPDGGVVERVPLVGKNPTNLAFGSPGEGRIYVVEDELGQMEAHDVGVGGLPLHG
jgi:gluconolactonase